jgi:hypothetical protein
MNLNAVTTALLPEVFWNELQSRVDKQTVAGLDVRSIIKFDNHQDEELFFDSPVDRNANPSAHFAGLKLIGERVISPYQGFLGRSLEVNDEIAFVKDTENHLPTPNHNINPLWASAEWAGGLLGYLMNSDVNPHILITEISGEKYFKAPKALFHIDTDLNATRTLTLLSEAFGRGQEVVNFLGTQASKAVGYDFPAAPVVIGDRETLRAYLSADGHLAPKDEAGAQAIDFTTVGPLFSYDLSGPTAKDCEGILFDQNKVVGYRCKKEKVPGTFSGTFIQIGGLIFNEYNSSNYSMVSEPIPRRQFLKAVLAEAKYIPSLEWSPEANQVVAFARRDPAKRLLWITVKSGLRTPQSLNLVVSSGLLHKGLEQATLFKVTDILSLQTQTVSYSKLTTKGFDVNILGDGSTVYVIEKKGP